MTPLNLIKSEFFNEFDYDLEQITNSYEDSIVQAHKAIELLDVRIKQLCKWLKKHQFETVQEEIYFFKEQKPKIVAKLIYYKDILAFETSMPSVKKEKIAHCEKALDKIHQYQNNNKEFYQYYRSKLSFKDEEYYVRSKRDDDNKYKDWYLMNYDKRLCTSHDYKVAILIAHDLLTMYVEDKIEHLQLTNNSSHTLKSNLKWTASDYDFTEIVYGLHHKSSINNGDATISEIATAIGSAFNKKVDVKKVYRDYNGIKERKSDVTKYITSMAKNLKEQIEIEENKKKN